MRPEIHKSINDLCVKASEAECDTTTHLNCLNNSILNAAKLSLRVIHRSKPRKWKPRKRNKISLDENCRSLKIKLKSSKRLFDKNPKDPTIRGNYFKTVKRFSRAVRNCKRQIKGNVIQHVENSQYNKNTPKHFWNGVNSRIGRDKPQDVDKVPPEQWQHYFSDLENTKNPQKFHSLDVAEDVNIFFKI